MVLLINYTLWLPQYINKLKLYFVVLFNIISGNFKILCFHYGTIVNTDNAIIYNGGNYEFLTAILDIVI